MKNKTLAGVLALFLGGIGAHKFYLEKPWQGLLYALFFWTFIPAIIALFEAIMLFSTTQEAFDKKYNSAGVSVKSVVKTTSGITICPYCAEEVKPEATKCKHCGSVLSVSVQPATPVSLTNSSLPIGKIVVGIVALGFVMSGILSFMNEAKSIEDASDTSITE